MSSPTPSRPTAVTRRRMTAQRTRDTGTEMALRKELFRRGLRYRVQIPTVIPRRRHDIVFTRSRVVVDVRGCFWHACPEHGTSPKSNATWWSKKLEANVRRDADTVARLTDAGWTTIVVWEHEDPILAADRVQDGLRTSPPDSGSPRINVQRF